MTTAVRVGIIANTAAAKLLQRIRHEFDDGAVLEMVVWHLPAPVTGSSHPYKYRLYYGEGGRRFIGYDNERTKGDHRHFGDEEHLYRFISVEKLITDFLADVANWRQS